MIRTRNRVINATEEGKSIYSPPSLRLGEAHGGVEALTVEGGATVSVQFFKPGVSYRLTVECGL